ncbi:signal peptidase II [Mycoplasmatota bacterium]|nr:signal peptidase II [Mycoplasmatota bacterium]
MLYGFILIIALVALDQVTKIIVSSNLELGQSITVIDGLFDITYHTNSGAAWSIFRGQMLFFYLITIVALLIFGYYFKSINFKSKKLYSFGISIIIAGTLGNFIDRLRIKHVIDFLDFNIFGYDFPVFNVADICLNIGVALFLIAIVFFDD